MIRIPVTVRPRSYDVVLDRGLLARAGECISTLVGNRRVFVITVSPVRRHWAKTLLAGLSKSGIEAEVLLMPDGEPSKRLATLEGLAEKLVKQGADRSATLIAFGGGVVGDVTGF